MLFVYALVLYTFANAKMKITVCTFHGVMELWRIQLENFHAALIKFTSKRINYIIISSLSIFGITEDYRTAESLGNILTCVM